MVASRSSSSARPPGLPAAAASRGARVALEPVGAVGAVHRPRRADRRSSDRWDRRRIRDRSKPVGVPSARRGRAIDLLTDLEALPVQEPVAGLVGDGQVRGPGRREAASLGPEDDVLEAELALRAVGGRAVEVARVVPPLGQAVVRAVVAREDHRDRIGGADRRVRRRCQRGEGRRRVGQDRSAGGTAGGDGDDRQKGCQGGARRRRRNGRLIGRPPLRRRPRSWAAARPRADPATPASTSSISRAAASSRAPAARARRSRPGPRRSRRPGPVP